MTSLPIFTWALSLALVQISLGFLLLCLALAARLWPTRTAKPARLTVKREEHRIIRHFRELFGTRKKPRHPAPPAPSLPS